MTDQPEPRPLCGAPITTPLGGGTRQVSGCKRAAVEDGHCAEHAAERRAWKSQFERDMERSTRHWRQVRFRPEGSKVRACVCGGCRAHVLDTEAHPWDLAHGQEQAWWDAHPDAPHRPDWITPPVAVADPEPGRFVICGEDLTDEERNAVEEFMRHMADQREQARAASTERDEGGR